MENIRDLLNLMKQNGTQISMSAEDIAEKYNARIAFKPGKKRAEQILIEPNRRGTLMQFCFFL